MKIIENKNLISDIQKRYRFIEEDLKSNHENIEFCLSLLVILVLLPLFCLGYFIKLNTVHQIHYIVIIVFLVLLSLSLLGLIIAYPRFTPIGFLLDMRNSKADIKDLKLYRAILKRLENNEHFEIVELFYDGLIIFCISSNVKLRLKISRTSLSDKDVPAILKEIESFCKEGNIDVEVAKGCYLKKV